jgi:hypothetical protein
MFEDIHRIDSTIFKPQQAASKQRYQGNPHKRRETNPQANENSQEENLENNLTSPAEKAESHHTLDLQA